MSAQEIERFKVQEIGGERIISILVFQDRVFAGTHDDPNATIAGMKTYRTLEGWAVNRLSDTEYEIVNCPGGPVKVRRVD